MFMVRYCIPGTVLRIMYVVISPCDHYQIILNISEYSQETKGSITVHAEESEEPDRRTRFICKEKSERI